MNGRLRGRIAPPLHGPLEQQHHCENGRRRPTGDPEPIHALDRVEAQSAVQALELSRLRRDGKGRTHRDRGGETSHFLIGISQLEIMAHRLVEAGRLIGVEHSKGPPSGALVGIRNHGVKVGCGLFPKRGGGGF